MLPRTSAPWAFRVGADRPLYGERVKPLVHQPSGGLAGTQAA